MVGRGHRPIGHYCLGRICINKLFAFYIKSNLGSAQPGCFSSLSCGYLAMAAGGGGLERRAVVTPEANKAALKVGIEAARAALLAVHSAAALVTPCSRQAGRLLRSAEGLARLAVAGLSDRASAAGSVEGGTNLEEQQQLDKKGKNKCKKDKRKMKKKELQAQQQKLAMESAELGWVAGCRGPCGARRWNDPAGAACGQPYFFGPSGSSVRQWCSSWCRRCLWSTSWFGYFLHGTGCGLLLAGIERADQTTGAVQ